MNPRFFLAAFQVPRRVNYRWALLLLWIGLAWGSIAGAETPMLPNVLKSEADGKLVLVDFYSDYCGTCQMMEPVLKSLERKTGGKVHYSHINVGQPQNEQLSQQFLIQGTPTYILYNAQGQALFRTHELISSVWLSRQIFRMTGQLKPVSFPSELSLPPAVPLPEAQLTQAELGQLLLVSFEDTDCEDCKLIQPYLKKFENGNANLHVLQVDSRTAAGKKLMTQLGLKALPAYVLFDNHAATETSLERGELFRVSGKVSPKALWDVIRLFGEAGV